VCAILRAKPREIPQSQGTPAKTSRLRYGPVFAKGGKAIDKEIQHAHTKNDASSGG
jgi:hypothetical protein